jgi:hypothetical protein
MWRAMWVGVGLLISGTGLSARQETDSSRHPDPVVSRVLEHFAGTALPAIRIARSEDFHAQAWRRVEKLVGFRIHRPGPGGVTIADAVIYLSATSDLYRKAAAALRSGATQREYVWCLLASVISHEAAHTAPDTEHQALRAEAALLRRCLLAGHLHAADGWNAPGYLGRLEGRLRNPREHR